METTGVVMFESSREGVPATTAVGITPLPNVELHLMREKGAIEERVLECSGLWRCERTTAVGSLRLAQGIVVMEECFNTMRVQPVSYTHLTLPTNREV